MAIEKGATSGGDITIDVDWEIMPARETWASRGEQAFDVHSQDTTLGPQPYGPSDPAPETDGGG